MISLSFCRSLPMLTMIPPLLSFVASIADTILTPLAEVAHAGLCGFERRTQTTAYLDCLTGCAVAASMQGATLAVMPPPSRRP